MNKFKVGQEVLITDKAKTPVKDYIGYRGVVKMVRENKIEVRVYEGKGLSLGSTLYFYYSEIKPLKNSIKKL